MKKIIIFPAILIFLAVSVAQITIAQTPVSEFSCIGTLTSPCSNMDPSLRNYSGSPTLKYVSVAGYYARTGFPVGDGGGGNFYRLGPISGMGAICAPQLFPLNGTGTVGSSQITNLTSLPSGLIPGELVNASYSSGSTTIQSLPGTEIASVDYTNPLNEKITLTLPLTGNSTTSQTVSVTIASDNNGTLIVDRGGDCYQKTNYRGDPREWGAVGDGQNDDTPWLQYWLGAFGVPTSSGVLPGSFGPWVATLPGTYLVSQPLNCPANATIQGPSSQFNPMFQIVASASFSGLLPIPTPGGSGTSFTQAVIGANTSCRLSGVGISASPPISVQATVTNGSPTICVTTSPFPAGINIGNKSIGTGAATVALPSVPKGLSVEALGRCIASYSTGTIPLVLMFTPTSTPGTPANFPMIPGYAMKAQSSITSSGLSSFPYQLYTDTSTNIEAQSSQSSTTLNCMTDGWVWHRQQ